MRNKKIAKHRKGDEGRQSAGKEQAENVSESDNIENIDSDGSDGLWASSTGSSDVSSPSLDMGQLFGITWHILLKILIIKFCFFSRVLCERKIMARPFSFIILCKTRTISLKEIEFLIQSNLFMLFRFVNVAYDKDLI